MLCRILKAVKKHFRMKTFCKAILDFVWVLFRFFFKFYIFNFILFLYNCITL